MYFAVSYDKLTKGLSLTVVILLAAIAAFTQSIVVAIVGVLVVLGGYAWSPRGYRCGDGAIRVERLIGEAVERLEDVRGIRIASKQDLSGCLRLFGSGGLFGYYGLFRTSGLGKSWWYATRRDKMVVVITGRRTTVYSPDDPGGFVDALRAMAPITGPVPPVKPAGKVRTALWVAGGLGLASAAIAVAFLYNPGIAAYTLTPDSLTIHDHCFYSVTVDKGDLDLAAARVVDLHHDGDWRPRMRTNGFANPHYQSGWFRAANGTKMRMYRAGGSRMVLLPAKNGGAPILYQAADPDRFLQELRQRW
jgi:hypothetical protein